MDSHAIIKRREYGGENCVGRVRWVKVKKIEVIFGHKFEVKYFESSLKYPSKL